MWIAKAVRLLALVSVAVFVGLGTSSLYLGIAAVCATWLIMPEE